MEESYYYTLHFSYTLRHNNDEVSVAQSIPYTYNDLILNLKECSLDHSSICRVENMCMTYAKNKCPILFISEDISQLIDFNHFRAQFDKSPQVYKTYLSKTEKIRKFILSIRVPKKVKQSALSELSLFESKLAKIKDEFITANINESILLNAVNYIRHTIANKSKKYIVLSARVHPGEVPGSWMMHGIIQFLLSSDASQLRKQYIFVIVPMLNPDGVRYGNYRCSLVGHDLNRKWTQPNRYLHPEIYYFKSIIRLLQIDNGITLFCDLHGHFRKNNVFMYGCSYKPNESDFLRKNAQIRVVPLMLSQKNSFFSYKDSQFYLEKEKESTARIVLFKEYGIRLAFTCEATFFGAMNCHLKQVQHMALQDYINMGRDLCIVIGNIGNKAITDKLLDVVLTYLKDQYYQPSKADIPVSKTVDALPKSQTQEVDLNKVLEDLSNEIRERNSDGDISSTDSEDNLKLLLKDKSISKIKKLRSITIKKKIIKRERMRERENDKPLPESLPKSRVSPNVSRNRQYNATQPYMRMTHRQIPNKVSKKSIELVKGEEREIYGSMEVPLKVKKQPLYRIKGTPETPKQITEEDNLTNFTQLMSHCNPDKRLSSIITRNLAVPVEGHTFTETLYIGKNSLFKTREPRKEYKEILPFPIKESIKLSVIGKKKLQTPILLEYERIHSNDTRMALLNKTESMNQDMLLRRCIGLIIQK